MAFGIDFDCLLEIQLGLVGLVGAQLKERQQEVGLRTFWVVRNALLHLFYGVGNIVLGGVVIGPCLVRFRVVGLLVPQNIEVSLGLLETVRRGTTVGVSCGNQHVGKIGVRAIVIGGEVNTAVEFLKGVGAVSHLEIGLAKLIMCLGEAGVDLDGIAILDFRLAVLALGKIFFAAVEVFLLAHVGITGTADKRNKQKRAGQTADGRKRNDSYGILQLRMRRGTRRHCLRTTLHDTAR